MTPRPPQPQLKDGKYRKLTKEWINLCKVIFKEGNIIRRSALDGNTVGVYECPASAEMYYETLGKGTAEADLTTSLQRCLWYAPNAWVGRYMRVIDYSVEVRDGVVYGPISKFEILTDAESVVYKI